MDDASSTTKGSPHKRCKNFGRRDRDRSRHSVAQDRVRDLCMQRYAPAAHELSLMKLFLRRACGAKEFFASSPGVSRETRSTRGYSLSCLQREIRAPSSLPDWRALAIFSDSESRPKGNLILAMRFSQKSVDTLGVSTRVYGLGVKKRQERNTKGPELARNSARTRTKLFSCAYRVRVLLT